MIKRNKKKSKNIKLFFSRPSLQIDEAEEIINDLKSENKKKFWKSPKFSSTSTKKKNKKNSTPSNKKNKLNLTIETSINEDELEIESPE